MSALSAARSFRRSSRSCRLNELMTVPLALLPARGERNLPNVTGSSVPNRRLDFWFDFASTYSYPAVMRIGPLAAKADIRVQFRPFLLGPVFKAQGWDSSPFNVYPAKGRYMWRDIERLCAELSLP